MNTPEEQQSLVQLTNTEYLRMLVQTAPKFRDRFWCYQMEEHLKNMEFFAPQYRFSNERRLLNETYENL